MPAGAARGGARADRPRRSGDAGSRRAPRRPRGGPGGAVRWRACTRASASATCCAPPRSCARRIPGVRVRIVGAGRSGDALRACTRSWGSGDTGRALSAISPAQRLAVEYVSADVFCLPTVQEGFGIVFPEAMAAGLPVVACRSAAVPEMVSTGAPACWWIRAIPGRWRWRWSWLIRIPRCARAPGQRGRRRATGFSPRRVAERFLSAVHSIAGSAGTARHEEADRHGVRDPEVRVLGRPPLRAARVERRRRTRGRSARSRSPTATTTRSR